MEAKASRGAPLVDAFEMAVDKIHRKLDNVDFGMNRTGELRVIRALRALVPQVVFDVGAHRGDWSRQVSNLYPQCAIHAFESAPGPFSRLVANTSGLPAIVANRLGLCGAQAITGASYLAEHGIDHIDFLKIEAEGMGLSVIRGFGDRLCAVRAIQFDYGNFASHDQLSDFCSYLSDRGFVVGKILPHRVAWFDYYFTKELFHAGNFLAVRTEENYLIASLGRLGAP